jgi:hypothetical protein
MLEKTAYLLLATDVAIGDLEAQLAPSRTYTNYFGGQPQDLLDTTASPFAMHHRCPRTSEESREETKLLQLKNHNHDLLDVVVRKKKYFLTELERRPGYVTSGNVPEPLNMPFIKPESQWPARL